MNFDSTSGISWGISIGLHALLAAALGTMQLNPAVSASKMPMLIEVTLAGSNAPYSASEGQTGEGTVIAPREEKVLNQPTQDQIETWRNQKMQQMIQELAKDKTGKNIGVTKERMRTAQEGLATGRGAGEFGQPGSKQGSLSFSGEIASRGYREPDFSELKSMITEETLLRVTLAVLPEGEVKRATLLETSGYPLVDQKAIELARKIIFDPLPADWKQVEQQGVLTIRLKL